MRTIRRLLAAPLVGLVCLLGGCTKVGGSVQRWHSLMLIVGPVVQSPVPVPPTWRCTSTVSAETLTLRCEPLP